jgi:hypothetical protein
MIKLMVDLSKSGIEKYIPKEYQKLALRYVWKTYADDEKTVDSGKTFRWVNDILNKEDKSISRAAIIFFLNEKSDQGILIKSETTGKGGEKGLWKPNPQYPDEETFIRRMTYMAIDELKTEL